LHCSDSLVSFDSYQHRIIFSYQLVTQNTKLLIDSAANA
jgi:hypothetical protein